MALVTILIENKKKKRRKNSIRCFALSCHEKQLGVFLAEFPVLKDLCEMFGFQEFKFSIGKRKDFLWKTATFSQRHLLSHKFSILSKSHFSEVVSTSPSYSPIPVIDCTPLQSSFFSYSTSIYIFAVSAHNSDTIYISLQITALFLESVFACLSCLMQIIYHLLCSQVWSCLFLCSLQQ